MFLVLFFNGRAFHALSSPPAYFLLLAFSCCSILLSLNLVSLHDSYIYKRINRTATKYARGIYIQCIPVIRYSRGVALSAVPVTTHLCGSILLSLLSVWLPGLHCPFACYHNFITCLSYVIFIGLWLLSLLFHGCRLCPPLIRFYLILFVLSVQFEWNKIWILCNDIPRSKLQDEWHPMGTITECYVQHNDCVLFVLLYFMWLFCCLLMYLTYGFELTLSCQ